MKKMAHIASRRGTRVRQLLVAALAATATTPALAQTGQGLEMRREEAPAPGPQQTFVLEPRVDVSIWATDNLYGNPDPFREGDIYFDVAPGINFRAVRPHFRTYFDYQVDAVKYLDHDKEDHLYHNLSHAGTWELYDGYFYVDTAAAMNRQALDTSTSLSANETLQARNATTVASYGISPYLINRFGSYADAELRYTLRHVIPFDEDRATALNNLISANLASGPQLVNVHWGLELEGQHVDYDSTDPTIDRVVRRERVEASLQYDFNRFFSLLGSFGAENYEDDTLGSDPSGLIWSAGFEVRPGARTSINARYRHRYDRDFWLGEARWVVNPTLQFAASHDETIYTYQELVSDRLGQLGVSDTGNLVDSTFRTADVDEFGNRITPLRETALSLSDNTFGLIEQAYNRRYSQIRANWYRPRDQVQAVIYRDERWSDAFSYDQVTYGTSAQWSHALTPVMTGTAFARYRLIDYNDTRNREDNVYTASLELRYRLSETAEVYGQYTFQYVDYENSTNTYENLGTVGFRKAF